MSNDNSNGLTFSSVETGVVEVTPETITQLIGLMGDGYLACQELRINTDTGTVSVTQSKDLDGIKLTHEATTDE